MNLVAKQNKLCYIIKWYYYTRVWTLEWCREVVPVDDLHGGIKPK